MKPSPPPEPVYQESTISNCPYCGSLNPSGWLYCHHCGAPNKRQSFEEKAQPKSQYFDDDSTVEEVPF